MNDELLAMFEYAVENNMYDLIRGLYPEVLETYTSDKEVIQLVENALNLMSTRREKMRGRQVNE